MTGPAAARRVAVIYSGGTLGMAANSKGLLVPMELASLEAQLLKIGTGYQLSLMPVKRQGEALPPIDSSAVNAEFWKALVATLHDALSYCDSAIVLHGTDTMAYSLAAVGYALGEQARRVVFTGSQLPLLEQGSDAPANLKLALEAAMTSDGLRLAFGGQILNGMRVSKGHSHAHAAFVERQSLKSRPVVGANLSRPEWAVGVLDIVLTPALTKELLLAQLIVAGAAVLRLYGSGTSSLPLAEIVAEAKHRNPELQAVLLVSACHHGGIEAARYGASVVAEGVLCSGCDITPEAAVVKLMLLLGSAASVGNPSDWLDANFAGELGFS